MGTVQPAEQSSDRARYRLFRDWLAYTVHELPRGVLGGPNGATPDQCTEMLEGLEEFVRLCSRLGLADHEEFIDGCRWHFEHYAHYLGRRRHFVDYATYVRDRHGQVRVPTPPAPTWL
jgi:hypothetical protein